MRILNVIASVNPKTGGVIAWALQFSVTAIKMGHTVDMLSMDASDDEWTADYPVRVFAVNKTFNGYYSSDLVPWLKNNAQSYDCVIIHGLWRYSSYGTWRVLKNLDVPYYVYTHGMLDPWFKDNYPFKHAGKSLYWPLTDYKVLRDAQGVIFTAEQEQIKAKQSFNLYTTKNEYICPIGINEPPKKEKYEANRLLIKYPQLSDKKTLLFLGRVHEKKGCDILLKAFAAIKIQYPELHLVMAGPVEPSYYKTLISLPDYSKITESVTWTGMLKGLEKWDAYRACDAFILPSHQENFGISVVEALACNKPVIISNKVDIHQDVSAYNAGFIVDDTVESTINGVTDWLNSSIKDMSDVHENARKCYEENFMLEKAVSGLLNIISMEKAAA